ncbi:MAG: hypothetical protein U0414_20305 [Polyangiaceae bacterium]
MIRRRQSPRRFALLVAALVESAPSVARAADRRVALDWSRAEGADSCVDEAGLAKAVDAVLGRGVFGPRATAEATVHGRIQRGPKGWSAHLFLDDASGKVLGTRDVDSEEADCRAFDDSIALVVALAVDALGEVPAPTLHEPPIVPTPRPTPWRGEVGVVAAGSFGLLPGVAGALGFRAAVQPPGFWPIGAEARFWLPSAAEEDGRGADFTAWEVGLDLCAPLLRKIIEPRICAGFQIGQLRGEGFGLPVSTASTAWLANVRLEATPFIHLGERFALAPAIGLSIPTIRDRFYYTLGADPTRRILHQPAPAVVLFDLTASVTIP